MKYLLLILVLSASALADVTQDYAVRAIQERWTFDYKVPEHAFATGLVRKHVVVPGSGGSVTPLVNIPTHFDLTPSLTPVKNQGQCGGCWAFAIVGAIENFPFVGKSSAVSLSEQNMIDCDNQSYGCGGGYFDGFDYAEQSGLASEQAYPFQGYNGSCQQASPAAKVVSWAFVSGSEETQPTADQIKTALMQSQAPVTVGIDATGEFMSYNGGVFNACGGSDINHMVDIVGWDDTDQDWIVRNSWGTSWGENGYFRILRTDSQGNNCNGIASVAGYVTNATLESNR